MLLTKKQKQSGSSQKGITVGVITATMVAALAVGGLWSRMNTQSESMAASKAYQADAAINLMLAQAGQLQEAVKVAAENSNIAWTNVTNYNGKLSLANTTQAYITDFAVPSVRAPFIEQHKAGVEFKGLSRAPDSAARLEWQFGAARDYGYLTAMAWLPVRYPSLCKSINEKLGLGAAEIRLAWVGGNSPRFSDPGIRAVNLPAGHVAYNYVVDPQNPYAGEGLLQYQRYFRSNVSQATSPLTQHRARCMDNYYSRVPALVVILYHGPLPTA